jgi:hypothetical protein
VGRSYWWFLAASSLLVLVSCVSHGAFQGGQLTKSSLGRFLGSEYCVQFQELDLNKNGQYSIAFRGFPDSRAWFDFGLVGRTSRDHESVARFTSQITVELDRAHGSRICKATGKLNEIKGAGLHDWRLDARDSSSFANADCLWLKLRRNQPHTLKITVAGATEALGSLLARPRLYTPPCC